MRRKPLLKYPFSLEIFGRKRLIIGLSLWLIFTWMTFWLLSLSASVYQMMYVDRLNLNTFVFPSGFEFDYSILDFFLAFFACLFGQSFFFEFIFSRPQASNRLFTKRINILTDNRNVFMNSLAAGGKLFVVFGLFYIGNGSTSIPFKFESILILTLLLPVLHLQSWMTIRRKYLGSLKWMVYTFLFFCIFSFALKSIKPFIIDTQKAFNSVQAKRGDYQLDIELPLAESENRYLDRKSRSIKAYLGKDKNTAKIEISPKKEELTKLIGEKHKMYENQFRLFYGLLAIDKEVKMKEVFKLNEIFFKGGITKIVYGTKHENTDDLGYNTNFLNIRYPYFCESKSQILKSKERIDLKKIFKELEKDITCFPQLEMWRDFQNCPIEKMMIIKLDAHNQVFIDRNFASLDSLKDVFTTYIEKREAESVFYFEVNEEATFQYYIWILDNLKSSYHQIWDAYGMTKFQTDYNNYLPIRFKKEIRKKYPFVIHESSLEREFEIIKKIREENFNYYN